ncbi:MAG: bifunctional hydroxymethylpyrimidine kinase/phosphomethylpyrimidine kinase [Alphaproteobacteria bacterium]
MPQQEKNLPENLSFLEKQKSLVLCIGGFDPTGGAGVLADVVAINSLGLRAAAAITAMTWQRPHLPVRFASVDPNELDNLLTSLINDLPIAAVKIGMLGSGRVARVVARHVPKMFECAFKVVDPVFQAGAGGRLADDETVEIVRHELLPQATVVTPNLLEASTLSGMDIQTLEEMEAAARQLCDLGAKYVLLKGGHLTGDPVDLLAGPEGVKRWTSAREEIGEVHGTGCTLSALVAGYLCTGVSMNQAVDRAVVTVREAIAGSWAPKEEGWRFLGPI